MDGWLDGFGKLSCGISASGQNERVRSRSKTHKHTKKPNQESGIFVLGCIPSVLVGRGRFLDSPEGQWRETLAPWHSLAGIWMLDAGWVQQSVLLVLDSGSSGYRGVL